MTINCIRCNKPIENASEKNAKYIKNSSDVRTHGPRKFDKFQLSDNGVLSTKEKKLDKVKEKHSKESEKYQKEIDKKKGGVDTLYNELLAIPNTPENQGAILQKSAELNNKKDEVEKEKEKKKNVKILVIEEEEIVPKTGIICRDPACQDNNDQIIWG